MPHLVNGHMRFNEEDTLLSDFQYRTTETYSSYSYNELVEMLSIEKKQLETMKYKEILKFFNTTTNIKMSLIKSIAIITAIAEKEGYHLNELIA